MSYSHLVHSVNQQFDRQIKKERGGRHNPTKSWYYKQLFNLTLKFTIDDWREIRGPEYYSMCQHLNTPLSQSAFQLRVVQEHIERKSKL